MSANDSNQVIDATRRWISSVVVGLNLCPFAARVFHGGKIRYAVSEAADAVSLLDDLAAELDALVAAPVAVVETTLLIHPLALGDFLDFNDFLGDADQLLARRRLQRVVQIASFHPRYQFEGTEPDAVENYTNRSPYPMLHLLRESSVTAVAGDLDELLAIPQRNIQLLKRLGRPAIEELLRAAHGDG